MLLPQCRRHAQLRPEFRPAGDNLQKWGTRTILIESGGLASDPEKQRIRRQNLLGIIAGLHGIATGAYESYPLADYWQIPENQSNGMHEVILENVAVERDGQTYVMDVGLRIRERTTGPDYREFTPTAYVSDLGDLHTFGAFYRYDAAGQQMELDGTLDIGAPANFKFFGLDGALLTTVIDGRLSKR